MGWVWLWRGLLLGAMVRVVLCFCEWGLVELMGSMVKVCL
jgi:uncharacterized membrane protein YraQ (UPF0718 family)